MNIGLNGSALVLDRLQSLALRDAAGTVAKVEAGRLWITLENDRRDVLLGPGDTWTIDRDGLTLVQAEDRARVVLTDASQGAGRSALSRAAGALVRWLSRCSRVVVPYY